MIGPCGAVLSIPESVAGTPVKSPIANGDGSRPSRWGGVAGYFRVLWSGTEPLHRVIVSDMLIGGTLINVVAMGAAFVLFGLEAPVWLATVVFFSPVPYNLFLVLVVWKTASMSGSPLAWPARVLSLLWAAVMVLV
jgi:hypothetical protein